MYPVLFRLGPLTVYSYGFMLSLSLLAAVFLTRRQAAREGIQPQTALDFTLILMVAGVIGSRVLFVILNWSWYSGRPLAIIGLGGEGLAGLSIHGGLIGGVVTGYILTRRHRIPFAAMADLVARPLALGMGLGRVGCFLRGCCYGRLTGGSWGCETEFAPGLRHPSQLYEAALLFVVFAGLTWMMRRPRARGQLFAAMLVGHGTARFVSEFFRESPLVLGPLAAGQLVSIVEVAVGAAVWSLLEERRRSLKGVGGPPESGRDP